MLHEAIERKGKKFQHHKPPRVFDCESNSKYATVFQNQKECFSELKING